MTPRKNGDHTGNLAEGSGQFRLAQNSKIIVVQETNIVSLS